MTRKTVSLCACGQPRSLSPYRNILKRRCVECEAAHIDANKRSSNARVAARRSAARAAAKTATRGD